MQVSMLWKSKVLILYELDTSTIFTPFTFVLDDIEYIILQTKTGIKNTKGHKGMCAVFQMWCQLVKDYCDQILSSSLVTIQSGCSKWKMSPLVFENWGPLGNAPSDRIGYLNFPLSTFQHQPDRNIRMFCPMFLRKMVTMLKLIILCLSSQSRWKMSNLKKNWCFVTWFV